MRAESKGRESSLIKLFSRKVSRGTEMMQEREKAEKRGLRELEELDLRKKCTAKKKSNAQNKKE